MVLKDNRVDEYIDAAPTFARPILSHLRALIHKGCPQVEETIKWGFPHFEYKGLLCGMAAFKKHCAFGFWKGSLIKDLSNIVATAGEAMGQYGRITSLEDMPPDKIILQCLQEAIKLNEEGVKPKRLASKEKTLSLPEDFMIQLKKNKKSKKHFDVLPYSKKKDYIEWVTDAKQASTRQKRIETAVLWLSEGKSRNWKYEKN